MRVKGLQKAINGCTRLERNLGVAAGETAKEGCELLFKRSQVEVPRKTGQLGGSGRYVIHRAGGYHRTRSVKYGYNVNDSPIESVLDYAAAVHEILKASHKPPTKAKFVEDPLFQGIRSYKQFGKIAAKKAVRKSFR